MKKLFKVAIGALLIVVFIFVGMQISRPSPVQGSAPSGLPAKIYSSQTLDVGPGGSGSFNRMTNIASTTSVCTSRVITTNGTIRISFGSSTSAVPFFRFSTSSPDAWVGLGHIQATTTNVAYDGGLYGCGDWWATSYATTTITITEFQ